MEFEQGYIDFMEGFDAEGAEQVDFEELSQMFTEPVMTSGEMTSAMLGGFGILLGTIWPWLLILIPLCILTLVVRTRAGIKAERARIAWEERIRIEEREKAEAQAKRKQQQNSRR